MQLLIDAGSTFLSAVTTAHSRSLSATLRLEQQLDEPRIRIRAFTWAPADDAVKLRSVLLEARLATQEITSTPRPSTQTSGTDTASSDIL
jgi:hypothetical protein